MLHVDEEPTQAWVGSESLQDHGAKMIPDSESMIRADGSDDGQVHL